MDRPGLGLRRLIGLLLILNLGILVAGWAGGVWQGQGKPLVDFNAEKIQLLEDVLPGTKTMPRQVSTGAQNSTLKGAESCQAWASLDADGVAQVQAHLRQLGVADADYDLVVEMRLGWWVYIPPLENTAALRVVIEDARAKGVKDMAPILSGGMVNALALGTFPTMDGARKHSQDMLKKGLRGVRYGPRPGAGVSRLVTVRDSSALRRAFASPWPAGLGPNACQKEYPG
jgi:hypothetical protein